MPINPQVLMQMLQQGRGQQGQQQGIPMGPPLQGRMGQMGQIRQPQQGMAQIGQQQQVQESPEQALYRKMNSTINGIQYIKGIPAPILNELPTPTKEIVKTAPFPKMATIFQGLMKDKKYINASNNNDIPAMRNRVESYLKSFNMFEDIADSIEGGAV